MVRPLGTCRPAKLAGKVAASLATTRIDEHVAELQRLRAGLTACIGCGCLSLDRCRLANPGDRAGRLGPGPRYWIGDKRPT
jgi:MerR family redox-sensitive transcriptional activator SoxR